jgi:MHS family alpha-ketoglutarate permease-like MFS transporter
MTAGARSRHRSIAAAVAGNFVEFYDLTIYAFMAPIIAAQIFPASSRGISLLLVFSTYSVSYLARPLGALVFGAYGDRLGRKSAMMASILLMAACSLVIGCTPNYERLGLVAPLIIAAARFAQGIAAGGEGGNAIAYLAEMATPGRRGFIASFQQFGTGLSSLFAILVSSLLSWILPASELSAWGWRVPFLIGAVMGLVGLYLRRYAEETPAFLDSDVARRSPLRNLAGSWRSVVRTVGIGILPNFAFLTWQGLLPTYLIGTTGLSRSEAFTVALAGIFAFVICILPAGMLSDRFGRRPMMIGSAVATIVMAYPTYVGLPTFASSFAAAIAVAIAGNIILSLMAGSLIALMSEQFETEVRATGNGLAFAISIVISGVIFPPLLAVLMNGQDYLALFCIFCVAASVSLVTYLLMAETRERSISPTP